MIVGRSPMTKPTKIVPLHGHAWTIGPRIAHLLRPGVPPPSQHFRGRVDDPRLGPVSITGRIRHAPGGDLLLVIHGLGGSAYSHYTVGAAAAAERAGMSCLRLNLRGADRRGDDYYHAGLTADLRAVLSHPELSRFARVYVFGYSLGGHVALRYLTEDPDPRVRGLATMCSPLDLPPSAAAIDGPRGGLYRRHVLRGLCEIYAAVAARRSVPVPVEQARRIRTLREWDERIIAPRFGFLGAEDYWARANVAPRVGRVGRPTLVVITERDPMVLADTVRPVVDGRDNLRAVWLPRGGHLGFPSGLDLGLGRAGSVEDQALAWLVDPS